jgi:hypothetical protein
VPEEVNNAQSSVFSWEGFINETIPVFIHYQLDSNVIMGEITYLNTKDKAPIKILGEIVGAYFRLLEFDDEGNITGIIMAKPELEKFIGTWFSPTSRTEYDLNLFRKDTLIDPMKMTFHEKDLGAHYYYQFGEDGPSGDLEITKIDDKILSFYMLGLTSLERGPNIAEVVKDTVSLKGTSFVYKLPDSDSCKFEVQFFKDFAYVNYLGDGCSNQFGHNATIEGLYLKVKD